MEVKYITFAWVVDGSGWYVDDTLDAAKGHWCFGMIVFKVTPEYIDEINEYGEMVKSNRLMLEKIRDDGYEIAHKEGTPYPNWTVK